MDSKVLDLDALCRSEEGIDRVMKHWQDTHSPLVYWTREMVLKMVENDGNKDDELLEEAVNKDYVYGVPFKYGLPKLEVDKVCRKMYQNDVVKLTLQISAPKTTQMSKHYTTSFGEQLGVIGKRSTYIHASTFSC